MALPLIPDDSFPPGRNDPCYCGSNDRFKRCCGAMTADRAIPSGIEVVENFLSPQECRDFVQMADAKTGGRFTVTDSAGHSTLDQHRMTEWVDFRDSNQEILDKLIARAFAEQVIPRCGQQIEWFEQPQLLRYRSGDFYLHHSDAHYFVPEQKAWRKAVDRDISMILYLNNDFEGGNLNFKRLAYNLQPKAGMLVWFPSDVRFEHMAMPVTSGMRYALVSWAALAGIERVQAKRATGAVLWKDRPGQ